MGQTPERKISNGVERGNYDNVILHWFIRVLLMAIGIDEKMNNRIIPMLSSFFMLAPLEMVCYMVQMLDSSLS